MKVSVFSTKPFEKVYLDQANAGRHHITYFTEPLSIDTVHLAANDEAISVFTNDDCSPEVLQKLKETGVKHIAIRSTGHDFIDETIAASLNISAANVPAYSPYSIAEHAVALMLALNRKLIWANHNVKEYNFLLNDLIGFDMNGKTVGIIGCGNIGAVLAKILNGFGCRLLIYDLKENEALKSSYNARYCSLEELASNSDIISIHVPLNLGTKHLINDELISKMKKNMMLINTGRGAVIDTDAVIRGLESGIIGYLGIDVYEKEKPLFFADHSNDIPADPTFSRLLSFKNVLITGHQAFLTKNALKNIADTTIFNLDCWQKGEYSPNELLKYSLV